MNRFILALAVFASCSLISRSQAQVSGQAQCTESQAFALEMMLDFKPTGGGEQWNSSEVGRAANATFSKMLPGVNARFPVIFACNGIKLRLPAADGRRNAAAPEDYILSIKPSSASYNVRTGSTYALSLDVLGPQPRKILWHSVFTISPGLNDLRSGEENASLRADKLAVFILEALLSDGVYESPNPLVDFEGNRIRFSKRLADTSPDGTGAGKLRKKPAESGTAFAGLNDVDAVPYVNDKGRHAYAVYLKKDWPRAFAISPEGSFGWASGYPDARAQALAGCNKRSGGGCKLYSVDDKVVWGAEEK